MRIVAHVILALLAARFGAVRARAAGSPLGKLRKNPKYKVTELHEMVRNAFNNKNPDVKTQTSNDLKKTQLHHICVNNP